VHLAGTYHQVGWRLCMGQEAVPGCAPVLLASRSGT
jgi:hypothetical protein